MSDTQSASDVAYRHIRDSILTGAYEPGTMLGEVPLGKEIGVSRTPVRAALLLLQDEGWVTLYPRRGALVRELTDRAIDDLIDARFILESTGVQRSSVESRIQLQKRLESHLDDQRAALERADINGFIESTVGFHRSFVEAGNNQVMLELYDRLADRQRYLLFKSGPKLLERSADILAEHRELVRELSLENPARFSETLRRHLSDTSGRAIQPLCTPAG
ncbi:MAG TPA: GntR family transcriptional regulator [Thermomicrobiales bacterium]|nr:GntR family transcriptional regulator [Thermomicrobiales bacterium]